MGGTVGLSGIVQGTAGRIPSATPGLAPDSAAFFLRNGQIAVVSPAQPGPLFSAQDLRSYAFNSTWDVTGASKIVSGDVDGDGLPDLVVMLLLSNPLSAAQQEVVLMLLRGDVMAQSGEFPFHLPGPAAKIVRAATPATDVVLGDFVQVPGQPALRTPLEVALSVNRRIRFYRYEPGSPSTPLDDGLESSSASESIQWLIAGADPRRLSAADFDNNMTTDLAVASSDGLLRVFLNSGSVSVQAPNEVNLGAFQQGRVAPALSPGFPTALMAGDFDGDRVPDLLVITEDAASPFNHTVGVYLNSSIGDFSSLRLLPHQRTGNHVVVAGSPQIRGVEMFPAMGDVNWDGVPDLVFGWNDNWTKNVRVLFGSAR